MSTPKVPGTIVTVDINIENKEDLTERYGGRAAGSFRFDIALPTSSFDIDTAINQILVEAGERLALMFRTNTSNAQAASGLPAPVEEVEDSLDEYQMGQEKPVA